MNILLQDLIAIATFVVLLSIFVFTDPTCRENMGLKNKK